MTTSGEEPQEQPTTRPGSYGEIAPGVPRYGQYAPEGWEPPQDVKDAQKAATPSQALPPAQAYPGFSGAQPGGPQQSALPYGSEEHLAPPRRVLLGSRMILAAGALQAISVIALLAVLLMPSVKASVVDALQTTLGSTPELVEVYSDPTLINVALFFAFVLSIAMTASYFWLARKIRRGANWARVTALVLAILSLMFLVQPNPLTIVQVGLGAVGTFLLFGPLTKEFFAARKANRGMGKN
ncbi:hypothetical protein [Arthrobacter psychrolactophilus]